MSDPRPLRPPTLGGGVKYRAVAAQLRERIAAGVLAPGDRLDSDRGLAEQLGVSRLTVRQAIDLLRTEGLLISHQGMGTFVRLPVSRFTPTDPIQVGGLSARLASIGQVSRQDLAVAVETPDAEVAERLGLDDGEQVVARRRVLYVDDDPLMSGVYFFPLDLVAGGRIAQPGDVPEGTTRVLLEMGVVLTRWSDEVTWRNPTPEEAATLAITRGVPLARVVRTNYDTDDRPVRVYVMLLPGDRHELRYDGLNRAGEDIP